MKKIFGFLCVLSLFIQVVNPTVYAAEETLNSNEILETPNTSAVVKEPSLSKDANNDSAMPSNSRVNQDTYAPVIIPEPPIEEEQQYIVRLNDSEQKELTNQATPSALEDAVLLPGIDRYVAELTPSDVNDLINEGVVKSVELDQPIELAASKVEEMDLKDKPQSIPWGLYSIGANLSSKSNEKSKKVKVAVFDTGISSHTDLNLKGGVSFVEGESDYADQQGHGSHMAGTISATDDTYGIVGVAPNIDLYAVKVINKEGKGYTSSVIQGIDWAINHDIDIINISFTSMEYSDTLKQVIQNAREKGILIFAAAGNSGSGEDNVRYPAKYPGVIGVGAVNTAHARATFSATGSGLDLMAPGTNVLSTLNHNKYGVLSGTSSATAFASGAAALLWEHNPSWTADEVANKLLGTATSLGDSHQYGQGLINIAKALGEIEGPIAPLTDGEDPSLITMPFEEVVSPAEGDLELASYGHIGSGQTITAGQAATVSLKLNGGLNGENIHPRVTITVAPTSNPSQVMSQYTKVVMDPSLNVSIPFTWQTSNITTPGSYTIRYAYRAFANGNMDDTFVINVIPPVSGVTDTYEPNNDFKTAKAIEEGSSYVSYIPTAKDVDFYKFTSINTREISIQLHISKDAAYSVTAYTSQEGKITEIQASAGYTGILKFPVSTGETYYLKIEGTNGYFGNTGYTLSLDDYVPASLIAPSNLITIPGYTNIKLTWDMMPNATSYIIQLNGKKIGTTQGNIFNVQGLSSLNSYNLGVAAVYPEGVSQFTIASQTTKISELIINNPQDSQLLAGSEQLFIFRPASTGIYHIFTGSYLNRGGSSFTDLKLFEDSGKTKLIAQGEELDGTSFSEMKLALTAGKTYYVLLSGYDRLPAEARITATVISSEIPYLTLDLPKDIDESKNDSTVYIFVPGATTNYKLFTSYYGGKRGKSNYTKLEIYSDPAMTHLIPGAQDEDSNGEGYSKLEMNLARGTAYYIKVDSYDQVYTRLMVTGIPIEYQALNNREAREFSIKSDEEAYFAFTPTQNGNYRFFTTYNSNSSRDDDSLMRLYGNSVLTDLINLNDDVEGLSPYGALLSKIEGNLEAGKTYYIAVKNGYAGNSMAVTVHVEDAFQSVKSKAQRLEWNDIYLKDENGQNFNTSSLYDVDYYKVSLSSFKQININIFDGFGSIEDIHGSIHGYFGSDKEHVFELPPGEYYLRVGNNIAGLWGKASVENFQKYDYQLSIYINEIKFIEGDSEEGYTPSSEIIGSESSVSTWDFTPNKNGTRKNPKVMFIMDNSKKHYSTVVYRIYPKQLRGSLGQGYTAYKNVLRNQSSLSYIEPEWDGQVTMNADLLAWEFHGRNYIKDGKYEIAIYRYPADSDIDNINVNTVSYGKIKVNNRVKYGTQLIPPPPVTLDGTKNSEFITSSNRTNCTACIDYFNYYVYKVAQIGNNTPTYTQAYYKWLSESYGLTSTEKFFKGMEKLVEIDRNASLMTQFEQTLEIGGSIPILGIGADFVNTVLYVVDKKYTDAALSSLGMIPVYGQILMIGKKSGKVISKSIKIAGYQKVDNILSFPVCNCFAAGTLVTTNQGQIPIEQLSIGDKVLSKNEETGEIAYKPVTSLFSKQTDELYTLYAGSEKIVTTYNHPLWIKDKGWKIAAELKVGDYLITDKKNKILIDKIEKSKITATVYNFTVADFHTYFVTNLGIWTHNVSCNIADYTKVVDKKYTQRLTQVNGGNSAKLRAELKKAGIAVPDISGDMNWWSAHHIIPSTGGGTAGDSLRVILRKYNIDVNSASNGVFLPSGTKGTDNLIEIDEILDGNTIVGKKIANHNGYHYQPYFDYVLEEVEGLATQKDVLTALHEIRKKLMTGDLVLKNPSK